MFSVVEPKRNVFAEALKTAGAAGDAVLGKLKDLPTEDDDDAMDGASVRVELEGRKDLVKVDQLLTRADPKGDLVDSEAYDLVEKVDKKYDKKIAKAFSKAESWMTDKDRHELAEKARDKVTGKMNTRPGTVDLTKLRTFQDVVSRDKILKKVKKKDVDKPIFVLRHKGRDYVIDGNHRSVAALCLGRTTHPANVLEK